MNPAGNERSSNLVCPKVSGPRKKRGCGCSKNPPKIDPKSRSEAWHLYTPHPQHDHDRKVARRARRSVRRRDRRHCCCDHRARVQRAGELREQNHRHFEWGETCPTLSMPPQPAAHIGGSQTATSLVSCRLLSPAWCRERLCIPCFFHNIVTCARAAGGPGRSTGVPLRASHPQERRSAHPAANYLGQDPEPPIRAVLRGLFRGIPRAQERVMVLSRAAHAGVGSRKVSLEGLLVVDDARR